MKKKTVLRVGAALLSAGFVISTVNGSTGRIALAEELPMFETEEEMDDTESQTQEEQGLTEPQNPDEESDDQDAEAFFGAETETSPKEEPVLPVEDKIEIQLPHKSVQVQISDFLPVQEEESSVQLNLYEDVYLLHIKSEQGKVDTFYFNQPLKDSDIALYHFNPENNTVTDITPVQNGTSLSEDGSVLSLDLKDTSEYVLVIDHGSNYENLSYTSKIETAQQDEPESEAASEPETKPESEVVSKPESETTSEPESESESETQEASLVAVRLHLNQDLETVPTVFSKYLDTLDTYTVTLIYSDGTENTLDKTDERYTLSVHYEDVEEGEELIRRTYYATIEEKATGKMFEDTQSIELGKEDSVEIKTEEMTSVILEGKKKWIVVRSTPTVTGQYAMNSDKLIKNIYYCSDESEVVCAEDTFQLQEGVTYLFLIELK